jgi:hypothetical protein
MSLTSGIEPSAGMTSLVLMGLMGIAVGAELFKHGAEVGV